MDLFNPNTLLASLLWSSIGVGYFIYGKRQQSMTPLIGGLAMIGISYLVGSVLLMSLLSIGIIISIHTLLKRGF
jgi:hypothetical protein